MQRYAEVSLKSVPLPEGVDPNKRATIGEAAKMIKAEDLLKVHQAPCSREGFLTGIGSGAAVGFLRYIAGGECPLLLSKRILWVKNVSADVAEFSSAYQFPVGPGWVDPSSRDGLDAVVSTLACFANKETWLQRLVTSILRTGQTVWPSNMEQKRLSRQPNRRTTMTTQSWMWDKVLRRYPGNAI